MGKVLRVGLRSLVLMALLVGTCLATAMFSPAPFLAFSSAEHEKYTPAATEVMGKGQDEVVLVTPPHCDDTGCAVAKPSDFVIKLPWDGATSHTILNAYGTGLHQGVCRTGAVNDYHALDFDLTTGNNVLAVAAGLSW